MEIDVMKFTNNHGNHVNPKRHFSNWEDAIDFVLTETEFKNEVSSNAGFFEYLQLSENNPEKKGEHVTRFFIK